MQDSIRIEEIAAQWLARRDCEGWSTTDQVALTAWLDASIANRVAYIRLEAAWRQTRRLRTLAGSMPHGDIFRLLKWQRLPLRRRRLLAVSGTAEIDSQAIEPSK